MVVWLVEKEYAVECDECGKYNVDSVFLTRDEATVKNARKEFKEWGWTFKGSYAICPECKKRNRRVNE